MSGLAWGLLFFSLYGWDCENIHRMMFSPRRHRCHGMRAVTSLAGLGVKGPYHGLQVGEEKLGHCLPCFYMKYLLKK